MIFKKLRLLKTGLINRCTVFVCAALLLAANIAYPAEKGPIDVVLVMDSSGSMKKTDPRSLRIPAAKMFISLLKENDRAGVISFSGQGNTIIDLTPVDTQINKDRLISAAEKIRSDGRYTNLHEALRAGVEIISADSASGRTKIIVLMSDGMMDVGDPIEDMKLVDLIRDKLSGELEESGIRVYTIAFTTQSDRELLERISKRTGGFYNLALSDSELHLIFTSIFESLKSPEMLPMSQNGFRIDKSVEEVTIVVTKGTADTKIMLNAPDGLSYTYGNKGERIEWFVSDSFDMITVKNPAEGRWEILYSTGHNNKAYVITDLKLRTNFDKLYSTYGDPMDVEVWLEKEGSILVDQDIIDKIELNMELTGPDGRAVNLKPFKRGDGTYLRRIAPFEPGNYKLRIVASGKTFEREKDFLFNVAGVEESKEDVRHEREKKKKAEAQLQQKPPVEEKNREETVEEISWKKIVLQFLVINIILGTGIFAYVKVKKSRQFRLLKMIRQNNNEPEQQTEAGAVTGEDDTPQAEDKSASAQETTDKPQEQEAAPEEIPAGEPQKTVPQPVRAAEKQIAEVSLDDDQEEPGQEPGLDDKGTASEEQLAPSDETGQETEAENEGQAVSPAEDAEGKTIQAEALTAPVEAPGEIQKERDEAVLNQEDLDALLEAGPDIEGETGEQHPAENQAAEPQKSGAGEDIIDQGELDAILSAVQDAPETDDGEPEEAQDAADNGQSQENIDDMWAEAFKEAEENKADSPDAKPALDTDAVNKKKTTGEEPVDG